MSTKKNETKKPVAKPEAKKECGIPKKECGIPKEGVWRKKEEGGYERIDQTELLKHSHALITVCHGDDEPETFAMHYHKEGDNYNFAIATSNTLVSGSKEINGEKITLVGMGEADKALFALHNSWCAFAEQFGLSKAYRLVRLELGYKTKTWTAVFASAIDILG